MGYELIIFTTYLCEYPFLFSVALDGTLNGAVLSPPEILRPGPPPISFKVYNRLPSRLILVLYCCHQSLVFNHDAHGHLPELRHLPIFPRPDGGNTLPARLMPVKLRYFGRKPTPLV